MEGLARKDFQDKVINYNQISNDSIVSIEKLIISLNKLETEFDHILNSEELIEMKQLIFDIKTEKKTIHILKISVDEFFNFSYEAQADFLERREEAIDLLKKNEKNKLNRLSDSSEIIKGKINTEKLKYSCQDKRLNEFFDDFLDSQSKYLNCLNSIKEITDKIQLIDLKIASIKNKKSEFSKMKIKNVEHFRKDDDTDKEKLNNKIDLVDYEINELKAKINHAPESEFKRSKVVLIGDESYDLKKYDPERNFSYFNMEADISEKIYICCIKRKYLNFYYHDFKTGKISDISQLIIVITYEDYDDIKLNFDKLQEIQAIKKTVLNVFLICNRNTYNKFISLKEKYEYLKFKSFICSPENIEKKLKELISNLSLSEKDKFDCNKLSDQRLLEHERKNIDLLMHLKESEEKIKNEMEIDFKNHKIKSNLIVDKEIQDLEKELNTLEQKRYDENSELAKKEELSRKLRQVFEMSKENYELYKSNVDSEQELERKSNKYSSLFEILKNIEESQPLINYMVRLEAEKVAYIQSLIKTLEKTNLEDYKRVYLSLTMTLNNFENLSRCFLDETKSFPLSIKDFV